MTVCFSVIEEVSEYPISAPRSFRARSALESVADWLDDMLFMFFLSGGYSDSKSRTKSDQSFSIVASAVVVQISCVVVTLSRYSVKLEKKKGKM